MLYKNVLLSHFKVVHACLAAIDGDASIDAATFALEVKARNRYFMFYPQFAQLVDGRFSYTPHLSNDVNGFSDWLPYFNKHWPMARDKILFKEFCRRIGIATPLLQ